MLESTSGHGPRSGAGHGGAGRIGLGASADRAALQLAFARAMVDEFVRGGVRDVVLCPGSRAAPLAIAAATEPQLRLHVRLDERSAGFFALGLAKGSGRPVVVVTTSGTAAAELHPAVVEADLAGVALVVCTADRPVELLDVGAPQAIDQRHLFGRAVRLYGEPGVPDPAIADAWRSIAARAILEASGKGAGPGPGPVHLDLAFREPLVPDALADAPGVGNDPHPANEDPSDEAVGAHAFGARGGRERGAAARPYHAVIAPAPSMSEASAALVRLVGRRVVLVAAEAGSEALALCRATGWALFADPASGGRLEEDAVVAHAHAVCAAACQLIEARGDAARLLVPDAVVVLGGFPLSRRVLAWLRTVVRLGAELFVCRWPGRIPDPQRIGATYLLLPPNRLLSAVHERVVGPAGSAPRGAPDVGEADGAVRLTGALRRADDAAEEATVAWLAKEGAWSEPSVARTLATTLGQEVTVFVGASMPLRDLEWYAPRASHWPRVAANRGANGIDGLVSSTLGYAMGSAAPVVGLLGDLAFLHDVGALVQVGWEAERWPRASRVVFVVADNRGGGIFATLPYAGSLPEQLLERCFTTPHRVDVAALCRALGFGCVDVAHPRELEAALRDALRAEDTAREAGGLGPMVVHAVLPDARSAAAMRAELDRTTVAAARRALEAVLTR
jgi:2-succinyl-5-enolpyruvyl-6-hydroxy-3-cyclohexene-1-carboxylate synthase